MPIKSQGGVHFINAADKRRVVAPFGRVFFRRRLQLISVFDGQ
jgi:hypothetical protein